MNSEKRVISVIVPVYNAASTLSTCLNSLSNQTYRALELLFVDDASTDGSLELLYDYADQCADAELNIKIIHHPVNRGVAAARNTALGQATGDYIYYVDADDSIEPDTLECLLKVIEETGAEIVGHEWHLAFGHNERYMRQPSIRTPEEALREMMCGRMRWNLWLFLVKRSLYKENNIHFVEGWNMGEDMMVMMKLLVCSHKIVMVHKPFYHYRQINTEALTRTSHSENHIVQVTNNIYEIERFMQLHKVTRVDGYMNMLKLIIKLPLLITVDMECYKKWRAWFPEVNEYAFNNKVQPLRIRLIQYAAWKRQDWVVKLYYYSFVKLIYGIIYR